MFGELYRRDFILSEKGVKRDSVTPYQFDGRTNELCEPDRDTWPSGLLGIPSLERVLHYRICEE
jgi:hypothetical protein